MAGQKSPTVKSIYTNNKIIVLSDLHIGMNDMKVGVNTVDGRLNRFNNLVDHLISRYKHLSEKPAIILAGDLVDFSSPFIFHASQDPASGYSVDRSLQGTWYKGLTDTLEKLLNEGFSIIPVKGNHDDSCLMECYPSSSGPHFHGGGPHYGWWSTTARPLVKDCTDSSYNAFVEEFWGVEGQALDNLEAGLASNAEEEGYNPETISGMSLDPSGSVYSQWIHSENASFPKFHNESQILQQTKYSIFFPRRQDQNYPSLITHLNVHFQRGYEILTISTIDNVIHPNNPVRIQSGVGSDEWFEYQLDDSLFMHDGRIRFSQGYVDGNEFAKMNDFIQNSVVNYLNLQARFKTDYTEKQKQLKAYVDYQLKKQQDIKLEHNSQPHQTKDDPIPLIPRPVRILCMHHKIDYYKDGKPNWIIDLSTHQNFINELNIKINDFKQSGVVDRNMVIPFLLEFVARLQFLNYSYMEEIAFRTIDTSSPGINFQLIIDNLRAIHLYGQQVDNLQFKVDFPVPLEGRNPYVWDNNTVGGHISPHFDTPIDGIINQQPGFDDNGGFVDGFLKYMQYFDVIIYGHTHHPEYVPRVLPTDDEINSLNEKIEQIKKYQETITKDEVMQFLKAVDLFPNLTPGEEKYGKYLGEKEWITQGIIDFWKNCDFSPKDIKYFDNCIVKHIINVPASNYCLPAGENSDNVFFVEIEIQNSDNLIKAKLMDKNDNAISWDPNLWPPT